MNREELILKLTEVEFAALDMQLFLDTHDCDTNAIEQYNLFVKEAEKLRNEHERNFGPLFSYISMSDDNYFSWIDEPWPWEKEFNPQI